MPIFTFKAINSRGEIVKNKVDSPSRSRLIKILKDNKLTPIKIQEVGGGSLGIKISATPRKKRSKDAHQILEMMQNVNTKDNIKNGKNSAIKERIKTYLTIGAKVTRRDLIIFTENFYLLKKSNFNNIHALNTIIRSTDNPTFKAILEEMLQGIELGESMYVTMEKYENIFPYLYVNMIKVGELSGSFISSLEQAIKYLEDTETLNKRLKKILIPNLVQFFGLLILLFAGTLFAIPAIQTVFDQVGTTETLPTITLWFSNVVDVFLKYWYIPTAILIAAIVGIIYYINTPQGKYNFHYFKYKMPIFGKLIFSLDFVRFLKAVYLNLQNGLRIQDALDVSKNVVKNGVLLSIIESSIKNVITGSSWIDPIENSGLASPMVIEMLNIGMKTDLIEMMKKLIEYMEVEVNQTMDRIMTILPEIVYGVVGLVLIFFVLVVLVPCIQVYMGNFLFSAYGV